MKKLLASTLALGLVLGMALVAEAQTLNRTRIFGNGNAVTNFNRGTTGPVLNRTGIVGHGNRVTNLNQGSGLFPGGPTVNRTRIFGSGNAVNNLNLQRPMVAPLYPTAPVYAPTPYPAPYAPVYPSGPTVNSTFIRGHFNTVNNINQ